jgi:hypothetical protein
MTLRRILDVALVPTLALLAGATIVCQSAGESSPFPPGLEHYIATDVKLSASERARLMGGAPVMRLLDSDPEREVAVFGAVWIKADPHRYVELVKDIENFERGGAFAITRRISSPPRLEDFSQLTLPDADVKDLKSCRLGNCEIKIAEDSLQKLRGSIDWKSPGANAQVQAMFRQVAFDYVTGYLEGGNSRLAVYRDKGRPTFVADEFRSLVDRIPALGEYLPDLRGFLLDYPAASIPGSTDFFYWQETRFGLKPTIRINHLVIQELPQATAVVSKMLYATHYFWTALEIRVLVPDARRGPGFWFVMVSRSRSDGLSGFVGRIVRGRVRDETEKGTLAALGATRTKLETSAPRTQPPL